MTGTGNAIATRRPGSAAVSQPGAALELHSGQTMWTKDQHAALVAMGIPRQASSAELGVFLHQCQRTGLDPFSKQIYLIYRDSYEDGRPVKKPTTQVGIDGFRVIRDRIARRDGLRVEYEDTTWYDSAGQACEVWLWDDEKPAACKVTVVVDGRRFPAVLRFSEYAQKKKGGELNKMWSEKPAHMIEKCCEADALRKAFPNDMAGIILEDAAPLDDPDAPPPGPQRASAADVRGQRQQPAKSEVVDAEVIEDSPFPGDAAPAKPARNADPVTGEVIPDTAAGDPRADVLARFDALKVAGPEIPAYLTRLSGHHYASVDSLSRAAAGWFVTTLAKIGSRDELEAAAVAAEARREQDTAAEATGEVPDGQ